MVHYVAFRNFYNAVQNAGEGTEVLLGSIAMFLSALLVYLVLDAIVGYWSDRTYRRR